MKAPKLICQTGQDAKELRRRFYMNQTDFWGLVGVTQSGGSRYESKRAMPKQVALLLHLAYGTDAQAQKLLSSLRNQAASILRKDPSK